MRTSGFGFALMLVVLAGCSDKQAAENFAVSPDQKHLIILMSTTARSIDAETGAEVARAENLHPIATFSPDGALFLTRTDGGNLLVMPTAGGSVVDLGPAIDIGTASPNHARIAFLRNKVACPPTSSGVSWLCADLVVAPSEGGEAIRLASGVRLLADSNGVVDPTNAFDRYEFAGDNTLVYTNFESALLSVPADGSAAPVRIAGPVGVSPGGVALPPIWCTTRHGQVAFTDGDGVAFGPASDGTPTLVVRDPDAYARAFFISPNYQVRNIECAVSPDGAYIVATDFQRTSYVKLVPISHGSILTFPTPNNFWIDFNSDGELLFWDQTGTLSIASTSGDVRSIGVALNGLGGPIVLSPNHKWIAVSRALRVTGCFNCVSLQIVSSTTGESWIFGDEQGASPTWGFHFSPDSSSLLVIGAVKRTNNNSTDSGGDLSIVPVDGGVARVLERNVDNALWIDSQHIAFQRNQNPAVLLRRVP